MKRYLRMDFEYELSEMALRLAPHNILRVLAEDLPYVKNLSFRDTSIKEDLDKPNYKTEKAS